ncbi:MAG: hypothetical protein A2Y66_03930 [Nitrospirae bacterium RBG_13_41_22]|nr:MAG: hypothetical protein A2Y66_03930 [Nitrospirae bacterium RBG_13_41_22]
MDKALDHIIKLAIKRSSKYRKGDVPLEKISQKTAELGIYLLTSSKRISTLKGKRLMVKLDEVQSKVDDFRKALFKKKP